MRQRDIILRLHEAGRTVDEIVRALAPDASYIRNVITSAGKVPLGGAAHPAHSACVDEPTRSTEPDARKCLSTRMIQVLAFIRDYQKMHGVAPAIGEIAEHVGASYAAVRTGTVASLIRRGCLVSQFGAQRGLRITRAGYAALEDALAHSEERQRR